MRRVVQLAAHGGAEHHPGALQVERPVGIAVVCQGLGGDRHRPLLSFVHGAGDAGRDVKALPVEREAADPGADLRIALVRAAGSGS